MQRLEKSQLSYDIRLGYMDFTLGCMQEGSSNNLIEESTIAISASASCVFMVVSCAHKDRLLNLFFVNEK